MSEKTIEEQIEEAYEEAVTLRDFLVEDAAARRLLARAEKRLRDLIAVRDGKAVQVYATVSVSQNGAYGARGCGFLEPLHRHTLEGADHEEGDRITILRGIAYLPETTTAEVEADSEVVS